MIVIPLFFVLKVLRTDISGYNIIEKLFNPDDVISRRFLIGHQDFFPYSLDFELNKYNNRLKY